MQAVVITPDSPTVPQGTSITLTSDVPVTWTSVAGSAGTLTGVDSTHATYTAPSHVLVKHQSAGCPVFPADSVYNTRIDNLPVHAKSAAWLSYMLSVIPSGAVHFGGSMPVNIVNNATPTQVMEFAYSVGASGKSYPFVSSPDLNIEGGVYTFNSDMDRHAIGINTDSCQISEIYKLWPGRTDPTYCPTRLCNSDGGGQYDPASFGIPGMGNGMTDAAGLPLEPLLPSLEEMRTGVIKHALRWTLNNYVHDATFVWPATANANVGIAGQLPYGTRFRLKSSWIAAHINNFSPWAKELLQAMHDYGVFMADGGNELDVSLRSDVSLDPQGQELQKEMFDKGALGATPMTNDFEIVDESSLEIDPLSAAVNPNNGYVTPDLYAGVVATPLAGGAAKTINIALQGVTVGVPSPMLQMQAGGPAVTLESFVHGTSNKSVSWSMTPALGTLMSNGQYTPPASVSVPTTTLLTAKSAADAAAVTTLQVWVYPSGVIRVDAGNNTNYTDAASGHKWWADYGAEDAPDGNWLSTNCGYTPDCPFTGTDAPIYYTTRWSYGDIRYDHWILPNGWYQITFDQGIKSWLPDFGSGPGIYLQNMSAQGNLVATNFDVWQAQGGVAAVPTSFTARHVRVTNNTLRFVVHSLWTPNLTSKMIAMPTLSGYVIDTDTPPTGCSDIVTLSPTSHNSPFTGDIGSITLVDTGGACSLTASSTAGWLVIDSGASGTGSRTITYHTTANGGAQRTGTIVLDSAPATVVVTQAAAPISLPAPQLTWASSLPLDADLNFSYPVSGVSFLWTFQLVGQTGGGTSAPANPADPIPTGAPRINPASQGLTAGTYLITVRATDGAHTSSPNSATVTFTGEITTGGAPTGLRIYPNPWRLDKHHGKLISFDPVAPGTVIKLFTTSGREIKELTAQSALPGPVTWDLTDDKSEKVASGIYVYVIRDVQGRKTRGKLGIIR